MFFQLKHNIVWRLGKTTILVISKRKMYVICRIDATEEDGSLGRLLNDDCKKPNSYASRMVIDTRPHIVFLARTNIDIGEEITFNYDGLSEMTFSWRDTKK